MLFSTFLFRFKFLYTLWQIFILIKMFFLKMLRKGNILSLNFDEKLFDVEVKHPSPIHTVIGLL